jgi:dihydrofolate reductase (trimethoprim resistance protein)
MSKLHYHFKSSASYYEIGDRVRKIKGSSWTGRIVGAYQTSLTPEGYAVESENEPGSVQIYPAAALEYIGEKQ